MAHFELVKSVEQEYLEKPDGAPWWNPTPGLENVYRLEDRNWKMEVLFEDGVMWVYATVFASDVFR